MQIKEEVLGILKHCNIFLDAEEKTVLNIPEVKLERKLYCELDKVLNTIGLKWNKKLKCHIGDGEIFDNITAAIETGEYRDMKKELQFFPTPKNVSDKLFSKIKNLGTEILEPSAGHGDLAFELENYVTGANITLIEIDPRKCDILRDKIDKGNFNNNYTVINEDFLNFETDKKFDTIIANPPFNKNDGLRHFFKMYDMFSKNICCILPTSFIIDSTTINIRKDFQKIVKEEKLEVEVLKNGEFKESGTMIGTIIVSKIN